MRINARLMPKTLIAVSCSALAGLTLLLPRVASPDQDGRGRPSPAGPRNPPFTQQTVGPGFFRGTSDWGRWDDYNWTILQMQREGLLDKEEQKREAGRERRRDELEKRQEKSAAAHEAYFDSILEASQAALRAPQQVFYRKPGYVSSEAPRAGAQAVAVGGVTYLFDQGIFWLQRGSQYLVVTAPFGAVVDELAAGAYKLSGEQDALWYFFGTFFREKDGRHEVVRPPAGTVVTYLPDGYVAEQAQGATVYRFGAISFKPVFIQGVVFYQVVGI